LKTQNTFDKIDTARKVLELSESATMEEIKANYKKLILEWHPDKCRHDKEVCEEMTKKSIMLMRLLWITVIIMSFPFLKKK